MFQLLPFLNPLLLPPQLKLGVLNVLDELLKGVGKLFGAATTGKEMQAADRRRIVVFMVLSF
jgi:hypothetical protein